VGQDGILRADGIGALRTGGRPVGNRPQDAILPHCHAMAPRVFFD